MPDSIELDKKDDTYSDAITYKELSDILQKSEVPVLVIFYSSKVRLRHQSTSNK